MQSIFERVRTLDLFHDIPTNLPDAKICDDHHLLKRAGIQDAAYRVHGFGAEHHTTKHDVNYIARDHVLDNIRESQVCHTAKLVDNWSTNLKGCSQLLHEIELWGEALRGCETHSTIPLSYETKWLNPPADFLPEDWCTLQGALSRCVVETDKYEIMIFLSTLTYSRHAKQELVQTLLAFATVPELRATRPPNYISFELSHDYKPDRKKLVDVVNNRGRPYHSCPEFNLPQFPLETFSDADERRRDKHRTTMEKCLSRFVDALICQWPEENVRDPVGTGFDTYISVNEATKDARIWFDR